MKYIYIIVIAVLLARFSYRTVSVYADSIQVQIVEVTSYNLVSEQTDSTPCETALGKKVDVCEWSKHEQLCATRLYPLRTVLIVGRTRCVVADRPALKNDKIIDL